MYKLVSLDLSNADISRFEAYERQVIPLLRQHGARLEIGMRSIDGLTETHVLHFPDAISFEEFIANPIRAALQDEWQALGVVASVSDVSEITYLK